MGDSFCVISGRLTTDIMQRIGESGRDLFNDPSEAEQRLDDLTRGVRAQRDRGTPRWRA